MFWPRLRPHLWVVLVALVMGLSSCTGGVDPDPQITSSPPAPNTSSTPHPRIAKLSSKNPTARSGHALAAQVALRYQFNGEYLRLGLDDADADTLRALIFVDGTPAIWLTSTGEVLVDSSKGQTTVPYAVRMKLDIDDGDDGVRINAWKATWAFNGDKPSDID